MPGDRTLHFTIMQPLCRCICIFGLLVVLIPILPEARADFAKETTLIFDKESVGRAMIGAAAAYFAQGVAGQTAAAVTALEEPESLANPTSSGVTAPGADAGESTGFRISQLSQPSKSESDVQDLSIINRYRWEIALVGAVVVFQMLLIIGLISERHRRQKAEVDARERMSELAHVNRYTMAGELATSIAHELSQPLGSILVNAETAELMLASPTPDMEEIRNILTDIRRDDERASEVIRRLRSLLRKAPFEPTEVNLNDIAEEAVEFVGRMAVAREAVLDFRTETPELGIVGDRIQVQQVIINLMLNALDATSDMMVERRKITIRTAASNGTAELCVSDRGPGIPTPQLSSVFEPFFTTKPEGMGMGLSIARTIVTAHHGTIEVDNHPECGATFRIRLPISKSWKARSQSAVQ